MKSIKTLLFFSILALLISSCSTDKEALSLDPIEKVVYAEALVGKSIPDNILFIDCRPHENFLEGHIPGAINIWRDEISDSSGMMLSLDVIEQVLSQKGISADSRLILYDDRAACEASRLWWVLHFGGFDNTWVLNGGIESWKRHELPISLKPISYPLSTFAFSGNIQTDYFADYEYLVAHKNQPQFKIIDARSKEEFEGLQHKEGAKRAGRIEGSIHIDFYDLVQKGLREDKCFLPEQELRNIFEAHGIFPSDTIVTYCHSGVRSAQTAFVLTQILKYPHVKNYDGSWVQYSQMVD